MVEGYFYVVQLYPDRDANILKLGFSRRPEIRLQQYKTAAPFAVVAGTWSCHKQWEQPLIKAIASQGQRYGDEEVVVCDLALVIEMCKKFFQKEQLT